MNTLERRSTSFGNLTLEQNTALFEQGAPCRLFQIETLGSLGVHHCLRPSNGFSPFPLKAKCVEIVIRGDEWRSIKSVTIVPKRLVLKIYGDACRFASVSLRATSNLTEMGPVFIPIGSLKDQTLQDLIAAVDQNQNLEELELGYLHVRWLPFWEDLLCVISRHQRLYKLKLHVTAECTRSLLLMNDLFDGMESMVKQQHKITRVEIVGGYGDIRMRRLKSHLQFNSFYQGSMALTRHRELDRLVLLGIAIMECVSNDARRTALLLSHNVDALCTICCCSQRPSIAWSTAVRPYLQLQLHFNKSFIIFETFCCYFSFVDESILPPVLLPVCTICRQAGTILQGFENRDPDLEWIFAYNYSYC